VIILAAASDALVDRLQAILEPLEIELQRWEGAFSSEADADLVAAVPADAVVIGPEVSQETGFSLADHLDRTHPAMSVVVAVEKADAATWQAAAHAGVRGLLDLELGDDALGKELQLAVKAASDRRAAALSKAAGPGTRIITVLSPKGGSGKTVVATNLAAALAAEMPRRVVLVDFDVQFGDVAQALMLAPEHSLLDATRRSADIDLTSVKVFLTPYQNSLYTLCAPDDPVAAEEITPEAAGRILSLLAGQFDAVVIDTAAGLGELAIVAAEASTDLVLVAELDVPSVRNLRKALDVLDILGLSRPARHLVLNRADSRVGLDADDVSAAAGMRIELEIPSSRHVPVSLNEGRPLVLSRPRSPAARRIGSLASRLVVGQGGRS
jgi:pilus assembly protein CpaE